MEGGARDRRGGGERKKERERERQGEGDGRFIGTVVALFVRGALIEKIRTFLHVREAPEDREIFPI